MCTLFLQGAATMKKMLSGWLIGRVRTRTGDPRFKELRLTEPTTLTQILHKCIIKWHCGTRLMFPLLCNIITSISECNHAPETGWNCFYAKQNRNPIFYCKCFYIYAKRLPRTLNLCQKTNNRREPQKIVYIFPKNETRKSAVLCNHV